jgi:putative transposase
MPAHNVLKSYEPESYYHVYNRGVNKQEIFLDAQDYKVFLSFVKQLLSPDVVVNEFGRSYLNLYGKIELNAFCLMPNHFHLLVYQNEIDSMSKFLQSLSISYVMYFNKKYDRLGRLFQNCYRASKIDNDSYLRYIPHYIHLNPRQFQTWEYSSLPYFKNKQTATWISPNRVISLFGSAENYVNELNMLIPSAELINSLSFDDLHAPLSTDRSHPVCG